MALPARYTTGKPGAAAAATLPFSKDQEPPASLGNFDLIARVDLDYAPGMFVEKWQSRVTGLTVAWASFQSPLLNCYMTFATEIFEDTGVPHTLEHLIFLGSEQYPYKGVLDTLANRAFASGTNAWTANDHTAYTLTTAGSDGFLRMLPVYLDHAFFPTLTDAGFTTEVYHINGQGEDAGVVFSEMQGRENSSGDLMELKTQRMLYSKSSAYRSETGGLMSALRVLTIDDIRKYHGKYYAPHNAALVVCGPLEREKLLETLNSVEERLKQHGEAHGVAGPRGWKRPFVETPSAAVPKIDGSKLEQPGVDPADPPAKGSQPDSKRRRAFIDFPEHDESVGEVEVTWMGPKYNDWLEKEAVQLLGTYLSDSPVSAIQKEFVERDDPLFTDVYISSTEKAGADTLYAYFSSVPSEHLDEVDDKVVALLAKVADEGIDMDRMRMIIKRDSLKLLSSLETKPADGFSDLIIMDFLYGSKDGKDLHAANDDMTRYDTLAGWTSQQWVEVLRKYFVDNPRLVVVGRPSAPLVDKLKADTKALEEKRRTELGEDGLKKLADKLEAAKKENDREIPDELLKSFKIPSVDSIQWIPVGSARNEPVAKDQEASKAAVMAADLDRKVQAHVDADGETLPFFVQFDHVDSSFVTISVLVSTSDVPAELRSHLHLYLSVMFSLPVTCQDGSQRSMTYEEVVKGLDEDTLEYSVALGVGTGFQELVCAEIKVEKANYEKAIAWYRDLIWGSQFAVDRLKVGTSKIVQSLPEQKRDGRTISWGLARSLQHDPKRSTLLNNSLLTLISAMPKLAEALNATPDKVVDDFETIRRTIMRPENLRISVAGNVLDLDEPRSAWTKHFVRPEWQTAAPTPIPWAKDVLSELGRDPKKRGLITALPSIESSYSVFSAKGISHYLHADNPALVVTIAVLNAMESFLWRFIRGAGLAYGASIRSDPESQLIHFSLYRSPDSAKAFLEAKKVIEALAEGSMKIDETTLESAKSSLHFSVADSEGTVGQAATESFVDSVVKMSGKNRGRKLLSDMSAVTIEQVQQSLQTYILPIFDPARSIAAVVAPPSKVDEIEAQLKRVGYDMERVELDLGKDDDSDEASSGSGSEDDESGSESEGEDERGAMR
ncbi:related to Zn2+-dependent endopeptidase, insulinase superfamily [Pseudozyma flocculosa]|uniref:Related to Zn2+-dependent endopeptidase, insulinase superfamily n=2 Tax=Pseudozyma flocculosa TaxID=84751 RepID=A0A5C3F906_9BASI|nr:related to Zn2+-dependent endopeptidase, insulinase superfamily [Pseudozyma flocculosa]